MVPVLHSNKYMLYPIDKYCIIAEEVHHTTPYQFLFAFLFLTINVPVVYMVRYKVVLRGDYP